MNARIRGTWLVWEPEDDCLCTLDTTSITSTCYYDEEHRSGPKVMVYCRDECEPVAILWGDDAAFFHNWWMERLEEDERQEQKWRQRQEESCPTQP